MVGCQALERTLDVLMEVGVNQVLDKPEGPLGLVAWLALRQGRGYNDLGGQFSYAQS